MNLLSKLHKHSILTGPIESYCLACGCLLRSEEESYAHIQLPHHVDKLQALPQLDGYKDDCILKIKEGYFCPYCNIILPTIKRVSLHVVEMKHKDNKISQSITRYGDTIFLYDIVVIDPRSWHGVDGTTCSVCNEDYADDKEHTTEPGHALKLIQAKCEFGDNYVYRNVDEDLFFCIICKKIIALTEQESHNNSQKHQENFKKSYAEGAAVKSKKTSDISEQSQKNGSPFVVVDNRTTVKTDSLELNPSKLIINNQREQTQVPKTQPTNKTQETEKVSIQIKDTLKQEAPKITPPKLIQKAEIDLKSNNDTSKVNEILNNQINDSQMKNTQYVNKVEESKDSNEKAKEIKNIEVQTKELKDTVTPSPKVPKTKKTEPVKPAPVKSDTNGTAQDPGSAEPYLYEFLKSRNFVVNTIDGAAFCALCDVAVDVAEKGIHCVDKHHSILYQKHIAKNNKLSEKSGQDTANIKKETNKIVTVKENIVPATEKTKAQKTESKIDTPAEASTNNVKTESKIDTPAEASTNNVGKEAKVVVDSKDKNNQAVQKENAAPENKIENDQISVFQPTPEKQNAPSRDKSSKKVQKKAAKAMACLLRETALDGDNNSTTKTRDTRKPALDTPVRVKEKPMEINDASVTDNGKASETKETTVTENKKASETKETTVTENKKASETPENTRNNEPDKVNGTKNGTAQAKTEKILTFIKTISQVDSTPEDVVINCKYVVGNLSFVLLVRTEGKVECVACNEILTDEVHKHIATEEHRIKFEDCAVVTALDDEFIRQVNKNKYHCGFCNLTLLGLEEVKPHLETYRHSDAKTSASWRLERYLPHMKHCEKKEVRSVLAAVFRRTME